MGLDGIYGSKICINCFMLNHLCSMWSSTDWFPLFKQYSSYMKGHCTYFLFVPLHYGDVSEEVDTSPPTYLGWQYSLDAGERSVSGRNNLQVLQTQLHGTDRDDLYCLFASSPECVHTTITSCPNTFLYPTYLASLHSSESRQAHSQGAALQCGTCFYLGKSHSKNSHNWKLALSIHFFWYFLEYFYQGIT